MSDQPRREAEEPKREDEEPEPWKALQERADESVATAREILKDAGNIVVWSRMLRKTGASLRQEAKARRDERQRLESVAKGSSVGSAEVRAVADDIESGTTVTEESGTIAVDTGARAVIVTMREDLGLVTYTRLAEVLQRLSAVELENMPGNVPVPNGWPVLVDLRATEVIDSSGIQALIIGRKALLAAGRRLVILVSPSTQPALVVSMTGLAQFVPCVETLEQMPSF